MSRSHRDGPRQGAHKFSVSKKGSKESSSRRHAGWEIPSKWLRQECNRSERHAAKIENHEFVKRINGD